MQVASFLNRSLDQFNVFSEYSDVRELETWNIPSNDDIVVDDDGKLDRVSWTGCLTLNGTADPDIVAQQYDCDDGSPDRYRLFDLTDSPHREVRLSYIGKNKNGVWELVLIRNLETGVYVFDNGNVMQIPVGLSHRLDTLAYFMSHIFVLVIGM